MENKYKYNAFISYRHISPDKEIADKLQKKLENYKPPRSLSGGKRSGGWRIFRDETELPTSSNLSNDIKTALEESEYLIVICSKTTGESRWCMEEVEYFKQLHNGNNSNIITLVADGNPEDVFPPSLCNELIPVTDEDGNTTYQKHIIEPLAANVSGKNLKDSLKKLNTEFLRIAAPILGCGYDNLYNREQKKKIKRIFAIGGIVLSLLLLFALYNSAMLWEINNQKIALAAANEDLQKKTEELNLSNKKLKKSNDDLVKKTKEAENNLAEANKQKKVAEYNLAEAEKQRKIAEQNFAEANRQQAIAEANAQEANTQREIAEQNHAEANRQKNIAEDNLVEANRQKSIAEASAREANTQREIAEENMKFAQDNEKKANEANRNLRIKNSEILANQAQKYLENDDVFSAISTALEALPQEGEDIPSNAVAEYVLASATSAYDSSDKMVNNKINLSGYVKSLEFSEDGSRLLAQDISGNIYIIDYEKNKVIKAYTIMEAFGETNNYVSSDVVVDGNDGLVLCNGQIISIDLKDGSIKWRYDNKDEHGFISGWNIVTNAKSDYIFLPGSSSYAVLTKRGEKAFFAENGEDKNYDYNSYDDYAYMSANGTVYVVRPGSSDIHLLNQNLNKIYPIEIAKNDEVIFVGENDECIFINIGVSVEGNTLGYNNARMICLNKKDMSVKWSTDYTVEGFLYNTNYNTIFEFTHNLPNINGEYQKHTGILTVSGTHVLCFHKQTGELYYSDNEDYEEILYCAPNTTDYSIKIATPTRFYTRVYLARNIEPNNSFIDETGDYLLCTKRYTFDKERKFVAHSGDDKFALASENSSEINMYHNKSSETHNVLVNYPDVQGNLELIVDDGNGIFAAYYCNYIGNEREDLVVIYDANNDICKAVFKVDLDVGTMAFENNKLLMFDSYGNSKVSNYSGEILEEFNLKEKIEAAAGNESTRYVSLSEPYIYLSENNIVICISSGIYTINISKDNVVVDEVISGSNLHNYCITNGFISVAQDSYKNDTTVIGYYVDNQLYYVTANGKKTEFIRNSISSIVNTPINNKIAFISKEGYIGIYSHGNSSFTKILLSQGDVNPLSIKFTPDGNYLLAKCADGNFIKYSVDTGKIVGKYKTEITVRDYTIFEFMDNESFYIRENNFPSTLIEVVDVNSMKKVAEIEDFIGYMNSERKIINRTYDSNGKYEIGYYNYLTTPELIEHAKTYLNGISSIYE